MQPEQSSPIGANPGMHLGRGAARNPNYLGENHSRQCAGYLKPLFSSIGAEEGTRTPTPLRVHGPEPCASANSATSARDSSLAHSARPAASLSLANAARSVK